LKPYPFFNIKTRPQHIFAIVALLSIILSFFTTAATIDINLHDTYFVVSAVHLYRLIGLIFFILWVIYTITEPILPVVWLKWGHVLVTLIALIIISHFSAQLSIRGPHKYYIDGQIREAVNINTIITIATTVLLTAQLLFIANLMTGIVKKVFLSSHRYKNRKI